MNPVEECRRQLNLRLKQWWFDDIDSLNRAIQGALEVVNPPSLFNY